LIKAYCLAAKFLLSAMQKVTADRIRYLLRDKPTTKTAVLRSSVPNTLPLGQLFVDHPHYRLARLPEVHETNADVEEIIETNLRWLTKEHPDFAAAVMLNGMEEAREECQRILEDPMRLTGCCYHVHRQRERCPSVQIKE
jgi:hypothetical protein